MKTALLIGRNASGKSNFGSALFDITFGFPEAFDYSDLDDRLFLMLIAGEARHSLPMSLNLTVTKSITAMRRLLRLLGFTRPYRLIRNEFSILIMQVAFSKRTILNESVLLESILNSPILR